MFRIHAYLRRLNGTLSVTAWALSDGFLVRVALSTSGYQRKAQASQIVDQVFETIRPEAVAGVEAFLSRPVSFTDSVQFDNVGILVSPKFQRGFVFLQRNSVNTFWRRWIDGKHRRGGHADDHNEYLEIVIHLVTTPRLLKRLGDPGICERRRRFRRALGKTIFGHRFTQLLHFQQTIDHRLSSDLRKLLK